MEGKLCAVIEGDGPATSLVRAGQDIEHGPGCILSRFGLQPCHQGNPRFSLMQYKNRQCPVTDHQIAFPMTRFFSCFNILGPVMYRLPVFDFVARGPGIEGASVLAPGCRYSHNGRVF